MKLCDQGPQLAHVFDLWDCEWRTRRKI